MERAEAETLLKTAVNAPNARFRDGQWEAIDALVNRRRKLMVVQRTATDATQYAGPRYNCHSQQ